MEGSTGTEMAVITKPFLGCVYHIDHVYALQIENTSESDPHSYEATKAVAKKAFWAFNGIQTHDFHNTGAILYQLSYSMKPCW